MAKKAFSIGDYIQPEDVSKSNTEPAQIISIPLADITGHEKNFYELSDMESLMDSIALNGLIEPIIVMPCTENGAKYKILSGHRRFTAMSKLAETEPEKYTTIAAIVREPKDEIIAELLLIEANRATRKLSSADIMTQAERYEELLCRLKDTGVEIPGRMRDAVAKAMDISASKLGRLSAIKNNLCPEGMKAFKGNTLNESTAYALSQAPAEVQTVIFENSKNLYEWRAKDLIRYHEKISGIVCEDGSPCKNKDNMFLRNCKGDNYCTPRCAHGDCCKSCSDLYTCKYACSQFADKIKKHKAELKEKKQQEKSVEETAKLDRISLYNRQWLREGVARKAAGVSCDEVDRALMKARCYGFPGATALEKFENAECDDGYSAEFLNSIKAKEMAVLADLYGCSVDYLLLRTDDPNGGAAAPAPFGWRERHKDSPPEDGQTIITLMLTNAGYRAGIGWWSDNKLYHADDHSIQLDRTFNFWIPMPGESV